MNSEAINSIINNIAEKLGIAVEYVVPALVRYNIAECCIALLWGLVWTISFVMSFRLTKNSYKEYVNREHKSFKDEPVGAIIGGIGCILFGILSLVMLSEGMEIIKWIVAPEGAVINYVLTQLK